MRFQEKTFELGSLSNAYRPCNELADKVLRDCLTLPADSGVPLPWARGNRLNLTGRLNAIAAISSRNFGVARRGNGGRAQYKCYYRRELAGVWFAEIWGTWKTAFIAAPYAVAANSLGPFLTRSIRTGSEYPGQNLALFLIGLMMVLLFLPRALLALGNQFASSTTTGKQQVESAGLIALPMGLLGLMFTIFGLFREWSVSELGFLINTLLDRFVFNSSFLLTIPYALGYLAFVAVFLACLSFFFWHASIRYLGAKQAYDVLIKARISFNDDVVKAFSSTFQAIAVNQEGRPQVVVGALLYFLVILLSVSPVLVWLA
ncbi:MULTISPECIES: hypothetical protein [Pseudomonas]|uniref:Uncharacterized protein n=1 Tax=Pseudomonas luteola TaxID=47886 RepID=A0ABS0MY39_PSELU|nr:MULTISPECIES: hypothetical protein [Pseudomonas]MBA1250192.1 hypothetical protein [Pseudomonas zeshuii]MBH3440943.1 hypothetical protein [Pseudomonas luteola]